MLHHARWFHLQRLEGHLLLNGQEDPTVLLSFVNLYFGLFLRNMSSLVYIYKHYIKGHLNEVFV